MDYGEGLKLAVLMVVAIFAVMGFGAFLVSNAGSMAWLMRIAVVISTLFVAVGVAFVFTRTWKKKPLEKEEKDLLDETKNPKVLGAFAQQKYAEKKRIKQEKSFGEYFGFEKRGN